MSGCPFRCGIICFFYIKNNKCIVYNKRLRQNVNNYNDIPFIKNNNIILAKNSNIFLAKHENLIELHALFIAFTFIYDVCTHYCVRVSVCLRACINRQNVTFAYCFYSAFYSFDLTCSLL